jgi:hypothetical protein
LAVAIETLIAFRTAFTPDGAPVKNFCPSPARLPFWM